MTIDPTVRPLIIGVGNRDRGDDGIGPLGALAFAERWPDIAEIHIAEGDLSDLLLRWRSGQLVVIVDAVVTEQAPGTITIVDGLDAALLGTERLVSTHGIGISEVIALAGLLGRRPAAIAIVGVEAGQCDPLTELSEPVAKAVPAVVDEIKQIIDAAGPIPSNDGFDLGATAPEPPGPCPLGPLRLTFYVDGMAPTSLRRCENRSD